jgi:hypothetical protein
VLMAAEVDAALVPIVAALRLAAEPASHA